MSDKAFDSAFVSREVLDNNVKAQVPRILDMADGLLRVVEALGDKAEAQRATAARHSLKGGAP